MVLPFFMLCVLVKVFMQYSVSNAQAFKRRQYNSSRQRLGPTTTRRSRKLVERWENNSCHHLSGRQKLFRHG